MKKLFLIIAIIFGMAILVSCNKDSDGFYPYTVKAHNHQCWHLPNIKGCSHSIQAEFKVNDTWIMPDHNCWHKILGISEGNHKKNSCRLVYMCKDNLKIIGMYGYANGERFMFEIDTVQNGTYYVDIGHCGAEWNLHFNSKIWTAPAGKKRDINIRLYPYIGGTQTISHDWVVPIKWH